MTECDFLYMGKYDEHKSLYFRGEEGVKFTEEFKKLEQSFEQSYEGNNEILELKDKINNYDFSVPLYFYCVEPKPIFKTKKYMKLKEEREKDRREVEERLIKGNELKRNLQELEIKKRGYVCRIIPKFLIESGFTYVKWDYSDNYGTVVEHWVKD